MRKLTVLFGLITLTACAMITPVRTEIPFLFDANGHMAQEIIIDPQTGQAQPGRLIPLSEGNIYIDASEEHEKDIVGRR